MAFGSKLFELFREADEIRQGFPVDMFIYESNDYTTPVEPIVTWVAEYVKSHETNDGALPEPDRERLRTPEMLEHPADRIGHWGVYWEVKNLRKLKEEEFIPIGNLHGPDRVKFYKKNFIPRGPVIIEHP